MNIYLAGPINGLTISEAKAWRQQATAIINELCDDAQVYDPTETADLLLPAELRQERYPHMAELPEETQNQIYSANAQALYTMNGMLAYLKSGRVIPGSGTAAELKFALDYDYPAVVLTTLAPDQLRSGLTELLALCQTTPPRRAGKG